MSPATVSIVLNNKNTVGISNKTWKHVLEVSSRLGYQDSLLSRYVKKPLRHLGVMLTDVGQAESTYFAEVLNGIYHACMDEGYFPLLFPTQRRCVPGIASDMIELSKTKQVDGWIIDKEDMLNVEVEKLFENNVPLVLINTSEPLFNPQMSWVGIDNFTAMQMAVEHLIRLGHQDIGFVTRPYWSLPSQTRRAVDAEMLRGYHQTLASHGIEARDELVQEGTLAEASKVYEAVEKILQADPKPTAFVTGDDSIAIMVANSLRAKGLRVPEDVSVVGFGDIPLVQLCWPPLTTVRCPLADMGQRAAKSLIRQLGDSGKEPVRELLAPEMVVRKSTASR